MDLFSDFLETNWSQGDNKILTIEKHAKFKDKNLIAYKGILSIFANEVISYHCIIKDAGRRSPNPYHLGSFSADLTIANVDCIEREYQVSEAGWWRLKVPTDPVTIKQWMPWIWKNSEEESLFLAWHKRHFDKRTEATIEVRCDPKLDTNF